MISHRDLQLLMEPRPSPCVSIFLPTHVAPGEARQDPLRLKNLLREAEDSLVAGGQRVPEAQELLEPARRLQEDGHFWRERSEGLALFASPGFFHHCRSPRPFGETVVVGGHFHFKPLLSVLSGDGRFFVLAVSQQKVRLLQGSRHRFGEVDLAGVPSSLAEALRFNVFEKAHQLHAAPAQGGGRPVMYRHGVGPEDQKTHLLEYFRQIDRGLFDLLRGRNDPLVLAGVEYLHPLYRQVSSYPYLVEPGIRGNPEELPQEELHRAAWSIVEPLFLMAGRDAWARYQRLAGTGRTLARAEEIVPAAHAGRVEVIFLETSAAEWGRFDPESGQATVHREKEPGDEDLLNLAALFTLKREGRVFLRERGEMPEGTPVAAILRY